MKRTINFLFIALLLSLAACQETTNTDNSETHTAVYADSTGNETPTPQRRRVYKESLNMWRSSLQTLLNDSVFGKKVDMVKLKFELDILNNFKKDSIVNFWIYIDNNQPMFAIANESDSTLLLTSNGKTCKSQSFESLQPKIQAWNDFITSMNNEYVYVKLYRYTWDNLFSSMSVSDDQQHNTLVLEAGAHTVTVESQWFDVVQVTDKDSTPMEGYIAIDVLISGISEGSTSKNLDELWTKSNKYDFAMPCPKACL